MKLNYSLLTVLFVIGSFTFSCKSDDDNNSGSNNAYFFKAKVDGVDFEAFDDRATGAITESGVFGTILQIGGQSEVNVSPSIGIDLSIMGYSGPGTYLMSQDGKVYGGYTETHFDPANPMDVEMSTWGADPDFGGKIVIEEETSNSVSGTFDFTVRLIEMDPSETTKQITNGSFHVKIE